MANTQAATLISNVRARVGRSNDTTLITPQFVLDALNEAQQEVVHRIPRQIDMDKTDTTTFTISTDDEGFSLSLFDNLHIGGIWILNEAATRQRGLDYKPLKQFRELYIPVSSQGAGEPTVYTRQGNDILFNMPVASGFNNLKLQIDYTDKPADFASVASTATSELSDSNKVLTFFAIATCFDAMAVAVPRFIANALKAWQDYEKWLARYRDDNEMKIEDLYDDSTRRSSYEC
jgi:hypothetical protein